MSVSSSVGSRGSVVSSSPVLDNTVTRSIDFVYDQYPESRPLSPPSLPPRFRFENLFAVSDPPGLFRPRLHLYPWVSEVIGQTQERSAKLARESKPLSKVFPSKHRLIHIADQPEFSATLLLNPDFSRLAGNKSIAKTCLGSISLSDLEKLERASKSLLEGNSYALWLMSAML